MFGPLLWGIVSPHPKEIEFQLASSLSNPRIPIDLLECEVLVPFFFFFSFFGFGYESSWVYLVVMKLNI